MKPQFVIMLVAKYRALIAEGRAPHQAFIMATDHNDLTATGRERVRAAIVHEDSQGYGVLDLPGHPLDRPATENRRAKARVRDALRKERQKVTQIVTPTSESDNSCHPVENPWD